VTVPETPPPDKSPDRITPSKALEADQAIRQPTTGKDFQTYMEKGTAPTPAGAPGGPSPMEASRPVLAPQAGTPTVPSLIVQAQTAQDSLGNVHKQLQTPNLQLKRSQAHLIRNKLTDSREYSRAAAAKLGIETPPMKTPEQPGMIARFLAYVNDGQDQFAAIQAKLQEMAASGKQINSGDMLTLQSKMALAQQEIEYSSTLLSRVTSSITSIMSIQL
jgi:hypothetical protein